MNNEILLGLVRHILTAIGGVLVAKGSVDQSTVETVIGGIVAIVGAAWSVFSKKKTTE
jgi:hypothetical protein